MNGTMSKNSGGSLQGKKVFTTSNVTEGAVFNFKMYFMYNFELKSQIVLINTVTPSVFRGIPPYQY